MIIALSNTVRAEITGSGWLNFAKSEHPVDGLAALNIINSVPLEYCKILGFKFVIPKGVTPGQEQKVVEKYLQEHPEELHKEINYLICKAYGNAWGSK